MADETFFDCIVGEIAAPTRNALVGGPFGSDLVSKDYVPSGVPVIRGTNMGHGRWVDGEFAYVTPEKAEALSSNCAKPGDIVFTQRGTLGQVALVPQKGAEKYLISQSQMKLTVDTEKANAVFLYYVFTSAEQQDYIRQNAIQTGVPHTNLGILRNTPLTLPPLAEQKAIAAVLGALDDKIELNRRMNATLEAMARALFQSWFVDFDPVRAKLDGHETVGLDLDTAALFPQHFESSPLGVIPKGWQVNQISEVVEEVFDGPHATAPHSEGGPVFLGIKNLTGSSLDLRNKRHISESDWPRWTKRVTPQPLDIVFSYEATLGFFALIPPGLRCCLGRRLALIRPRAKEGHVHFWFHQFIGPNFQRYLMQHSVQGATVDRIPLIQFPNFLVLNPPLALKEAFENQVAPLWAAIHSNAKQAHILATLRDTLLPKLLSGELSVAELNDLLKMPMTINPR
jgi:type I restriction enzyme, S subunit